MSSWRLFTYLTPFFSPRVHHAIWRWDLKRAPGWTLDALWDRVRQVSTLLFVLIVFVYASAWCLAPWLQYSRPAVIPWPVLCMLAIPILLLPSLALWILPLGVIIGPTVARERLHHTWDVLRLIPATIDAILLAKIYAAFWPLFPLIRRAGIALLLASLVAATLSLNLLDSLTLTYPTTHGQICGGGIALLLAGAGLYLFDRAQQFTLMTAAALVASASARSAQHAITQATLAAGVAWLVDVGMAAVMLAILPRWVTLGIGARAAILVMLGPTGSYMAELHIHEATACIAATFILRELAIRALWRWTVRLATTD
jgi:hypothetical protein